MRRLYIAGAGGHGKVIADIAGRSKRYKEIFFLDDETQKKEVMGFAVVGKTDYFDLIDKENDEVIVAIGNANIRRRLQESYEELGLTMARLIHPDAIIGRGVFIGAGTVVIGGTVLNADAKIGKGCIINTSSSVDHDCNIGNYVHIAVGAHVCGDVSIGATTWIGAGSIVNNEINICDNCTIGSGAVVTRDIDTEGIYVGVPAKKVGNRAWTGKKS